ncbi:ExeA family protein [Shewanella sp. SR43-4]|uniref:ExeA family protein n=1 Tax=Shewanella sp. SR43-4 TaxID=2760942 RepID=UPI0015FD2F3E|nr:AAA family ATPase [Shewanella sp. SR43-4]MBB1319677.1 ExeA family protein [Shewanella sp. SR43-4]
MYLQHFGLSQLPFTLTPNTSFFFGLAPHVEALQVLQTALETGEGFIKVTGEVGTGKTLVCRKLLNDLPAQYHCAYLPNPYLNPKELRWAVAAELGLSLPNKVDQQQLTRLIHERLLALNHQGFHVVLVLDEAQSLPDESIEALRLFTNLETENRKLLQVVLFGQPELDQRLAQPKFRQLRQRITFSYGLRPLTWDEIHAYIRYRLAIAGYQGPELFAAADIKRIARAARGIPRLVNILAHKSLLLCYGQGEKKVLTRHCLAAITDTEDINLQHKVSVSRLNILLVVLLAAVVLVIGLNSDSCCGEWVTQISEIK